ncbi:RNase adapter RapZ [Saccharopolyspora sp. NPDC002686]|uniref:RapZ C-terminal domain-containing protein n=1 Tax=Saccharopolyspora sp. NPDC002686 TaxID=3154541 RepID=UPI00331FE222
MSNVRVMVTSFGYGHDRAPHADLTLDVRRRFRNPHHDPAMRQLTGLDAPVRQHVLDTPGVTTLIDTTAAVVRGLVTATADAPNVQVAVGCVGGRHRSVAIAEAVGAALEAAEIAVVVWHRDLDRDVLPSGTQQHLDQDDPR